MDKKGVGLKNSAALADAILEKGTGPKGHRLGRERDVCMAALDIFPPASACHGWFVCHISTSFMKNSEAHDHRGCVSFDSTEVSSNFSDSDVTFDSGVFSNFSGLLWVAHVTLFARRVMHVTCTLCPVSALELS